MKDIKKVDFFECDGDNIIVFYEYKGGDNVLTIPISDFDKYIFDNELNILVNDDFDPFSSHGHTQTINKLEFEDYLNYANLEIYINDKS